MEIGAVLITMLILFRPTSLKAIFSNKSKEQLIVFIEIHKTLALAYLNIPSFLTPLNGNIYKSYKKYQIYLTVHLMLYLGARYFLFREGLNRIICIPSVIFITLELSRKHRKSFRSHGPTGSPWEPLEYPSYKEEVLFKSSYQKPHFYYIISPVMFIFMARVVFLKCHTLHNYVIAKISFILALRPLKNILNVRFHLQRIHRIALFIYQSFT